MSATNSVGRLLFAHRLDFSHCLEMSFTGFIFVWSTVPSEGERKVERVFGLHLSGSPGIKGESQWYLIPETSTYLQCFIAKFLSETKGKARSKAQAQHWVQFCNILLISEVTGWQLHGDWVFWILHIHFLLCFILVLDLTKLLFCGLCVHPHFKPLIFKGIII